MRQTINPLNVLRNRAAFCMLVIAMVSFVLTSVPVYGQQIDRRRAGPLPTQNPVPANTAPAKAYNPPASGIQNPTTVNNPAGNYSAPNVQGGQAPVMPTSPYNTGVSTNPFQPAAPQRSGYGQAPSQPIIQRNPFQPQQGAYRPAQAATIGQAVRPQLSEKPFSNVTPQSPYSPYMYIYAGRGGLGGGGDNYNLYVRPMQQQQAYDARLNRQVESLQNTILKQQTQINNQNRVLGQIEQNNPGLIPTQNSINPGSGNSSTIYDTNPYGGSPYFMNQYQQYFNTRGSN